MSEPFVCGICDGTEPDFSWKDAHGIAEHRPCGAPYRLLHYDDANNRIKRAPELLLAPAWIERTRAYWQEHHRHVAPGAFSFPGGQCLATAEDHRIFHDWIKQFPDALAPDTGAPECEEWP